jgi:hypothetical protein
MSSHDRTSEVVRSTYTFADTGCRDALEQHLYNARAIDRLRWNIERRRIYIAFSRRHCTSSSTEWGLVDRVVRILKPFYHYQATLDLCIDDAYTPAVISLISQLNKKLQSTAEDKGLLQTKTAVRDATKRCFGTTKQKSNLIAATLC